MRCETVRPCLGLGLRVGLGLGFGLGLGLRWMLRSEAEVLIGARAEGQAGATGWARTGTRTDGRWK